MQIKIEVFDKLVLSFWGFAGKHAQSTKNKKFAYLFSISRKAWRWSWFLPVDKLENFLQDDSITLCVCSQISLT